MTFTWLKCDKHADDGTFYCKTCVRIAMVEENARNRELVRQACEESERKDREVVQKLCDALGMNLYELKHALKALDKLPPY